MAHEMPQIEGVQHRFVPAAGLNFHVAEAGEGDGTPILLVHGWPQHWYAWRLVMPELAKDHRVIAIDLRGFGWTDIAWEGFEKENMADDIAAVLDELGIERVDYIGHDWGAWIGYLLAMRRPERLEHLLALSVPSPFARTSAMLRALPGLRYQALLSSPLAIRLQRRPAYVNRLIRRWGRNHPNLSKDVRRIYARDLRASTRARATMLMYRTFTTREAPRIARGRYRGERITVPTRILHGDRSPILPAVLYGADERHFDDVEIESVPGAAHFLPEEEPEVVVRAARELFGTVTEGAGRALA